MRRLTVFPLAVAGALIMAGCGGPGGAPMSPAEREEFTDNFTRMDPLATGEIPAANSDGQMP